MKFLFFNLAVIGALAYLVLKSDPNLGSVPSDPLKASTAIDKAKAVVKEVKKAAMDASQDIKRMVASELEKVGDVHQRSEFPKIDNELTPEKQVSVQTAPKEVTERIVHKAPQNNASKVPPSQKQLDDSATNKPEIAEEKQEMEFMTAKERRRELNRLARDMELIFVDKMNK